MRIGASAVLTVVAMSLTVALTLPAQQLIRAGIASSGTAIRFEAARSFAPMVVEPPAPTSPWPYVVVGAFIGGVATVAAVSWSIERSGKDCICSPIAFVPIAMGGALLGGTGGYIVYRIRL